MDVRKKSLDVIKRVGIPHLEVGRSESVPLAAARRRMKYAGVHSLVDGVYGDVRRQTSFSEEFRVPLGTDNKTVESDLK